MLVVPKASALWRTLNITFRSPISQHSLEAEHHNHKKLLPCRSAGRNARRSGPRPSLSRRDIRVPDVEDDCPRLRATVQSQVKRFRGLGLASENWTSLIISCVLSLASTLNRISAEVGVLVHHFLTAYKERRNPTKAVMPGVL